MRSKQEIFDQVVRGLAYQGFERSIDMSRERWAEYESECRYRSPDGLKCAVGWLIPDDKYNPKLEGKSVGTEQVQKAVGVSKGWEIRFLEDLQGLHDYSISPDHMRERLKEFAVKNMLKWPKGIS